MSSAKRRDVYNMTYAVAIPIGPLQGVRRNKQDSGGRPPTRHGVENGMLSSLLCSCDGHVSAISYD